MHDPLQTFRTAILAALGHAPELIEPGKFQRVQADRESHRRCPCARLTFD